MAVWPFSLKKFTTSRRRWHVARARNESKKWIRCDEVALSTSLGRKRRRRRARHLFRQSLLQKVESLPGPSFGSDNGGRIRITLPEQLDLEQREIGCLGTFEALHRVIGTPWQSPLHIGFDRLGHICPESCLLLASQIYLWRQRAKRRLRVFSDSWNPHVLELLRDMGYFELLELPDPVAGIVRKTKFLRFTTGLVVDGQKADDLRSRLEELVEIEVPRHQLNNGLTEAITNTINHAYTTGAPKRWWISGAYDESESELRVLCLDRGVGIPATLPKSKKWPKINETLQKLGLVNDHGEMIKHAVNTRTTGTGKMHRGRGLGQLRDFAKEFEESSLHITSGRGRYVMSKSQAKITERVSHLDRDIRGTLISWRAKIK